ncbi:MAG: bifunctional pyr operon transcriptional regulator/uracil phosphoribosyltransferase PyrR [Cyclobacteriaceae bacterium]|nr:bifunctional pyr operon transcriptional regulator/uracil phosphoribosyltransferase PyrR [Cyclobacteriaceae bacterium]
MARKLIFNQDLLEITISRLCKQLIENHNTFGSSVILGLQPRGVIFSKRIAGKMEELTGRPVPAGALDITFYRDDFRRRNNPLKANTTDVPFIIEEKNVILVDDVLFTGRSVRAALDAMSAFGRPKTVELLVLVDRKYVRDLPIEPNYVGRHVITLPSQNVEVQWKEQGYKKDSIWLINKDEEN